MTRVVAEHTAHVERRASPHVELDAGLGADPHHAVRAHDGVGRQHAEHQGEDERGKGDRAHRRSIGPHGEPRNEAVAILRGP